MEGILKVSPEQLTGAASEFGSYGATVRNITAEMTSIVAGLSSAPRRHRASPCHDSGTCDRPDRDGKSL